MKKSLSSLPLAFALSIGVAACGSPEGEPATLDAAGAEVPFASGVTADDLERRVDQFAPVELTFDASLLDEPHRRAMKALVQASDILNEIFLDQVWSGNRALRERLAEAEGEGADAARAYFDIMYGPWDRLEHEEPFLTAGPKPPGAGYYPEDATKAELEAWLADHPELRDEFASYFTMIQRDGDGFVIVPYNEAHGDRLTEAGSLLREAAGLIENETVSRFLETRADAFLSNDYFESDVAWMRIADNLIDPTIGPYEVYEDVLFGYKAAFESFITLRDPTESAKLDRLAALMPDLEAALPIPDEHKYLDRPFTSPISVVTEVYAAGDTRSGVQTLAFNLPNDARVRAQEGSKKVMLTNIIEAKFEKILAPIASVLMDPDQVEDVAFDPFYTQVLVHELAHGLGPDYVTGSDRATTVNAALQELYSPIEEAKADVVGVHSLAVLTGRGEYTEDFLRQVYVSHAASLFRCVRFGTTEAHGKGCLMQFNWFLETGAILHDSDTGRFSVDLEAISGAVSGLAREFLLLQATGDYDATAAFMERYGEVPDVLTAAIERLGEVPVDIRPTYAVKELMEAW
ncbi:MAG: peptidase [Gemmatimonadota bacterium]|nr:peptidase [Gemmatimonadota bacterium]